MWCLSTVLGRQDLEFGGLACDKQGQAKHRDLPPSYYLIHIFKKAAEPQNSACLNTPSGYLMGGPRHKSCHAERQGDGPGGIRVLTFVSFSHSSKAVQGPASGGPRLLIAASLGVWYDMWHVCERSVRHSTS